MKSVAWDTPGRSSTSPTSIDRDGLGESRTGSKQGRSDDGKRSIKWPGRGGGGGGGKPPLTFWPLKNNFPTFSNKVDN